MPFIFTLYEKIHILIDITFNYKNLKHYFQINILIGKFIGLSSGVLLLNLQTRSIRNCKSIYGQNTLIED